MRIGGFSFRQRSINRAVSPSLTAVAVLMIALGGFMLGFVMGSWMERISFYLPLGASCWWTGNRARQSRGRGHASSRGCCLSSWLCISVFGYLYTRLEGLAFVCVARYQPHVNILPSSKYQSVIHKARSLTHPLHVSFVFPTRRKTTEQNGRSGQDSWWIYRPFPAISCMVFTKELGTLFFLAGLVTSAFSKGQA